MVERKKAIPAKTENIASKRSQKGSTAKQRTFADIIDSHGEAIRDVSNRLRQIALEEIPEAAEGIFGGAKVGIALYSIGSGTNVICGIQPMPKACLFYVHHITDMDSTALQLEGKGGNNRHVKVVSVAEINEDAIRMLIRLARKRMG